MIAEHAAAKSPQTLAVAFHRIAAAPIRSWTLAVMASCCSDSTMRSAWICSRNDAFGNVAVMLAALGVFGTGSAWPDLLVASVISGLALAGAWTVLRQAGGELRASTSLAR